MIIITYLQTFEKMFIILYMKNIKTNAMRHLDAQKIKYEVYTYDAEDGKIDGLSVAQKCHQDVRMVYKTLVARSASNKIYVFVVNVADELDLKKCAKAVHEKSIAMVHVNELLGLTGYVRGGCSPIGMKKKYPVILSDTAASLDSIIFSGGKIGCQIHCSVNDFMKVTQAFMACII